MKDLKKIIIEKEFEAPRGKVWEAWTNPELVKKWWGPEGFTAPSIRIDLRVGGKYVYCMHGPKNSQFDRDLYSAGVYKKIVPEKSLTVTDYFSDEKGNKVPPAAEGMGEDMPDELEVSVRFVEEGPEKTKLVIEYPVSDSGQYRAMLKSGMREGWSSSLDKLARSLK